MVLEEGARNLTQRENAQKLDRKRHLLVTKLQHLRKCVNVLVIGPDHAGGLSMKKIYSLFLVPSNYYDFCSKFKINDQLE